MISGDVVMDNDNRHPNGKDRDGKKSHHRHFTEQHVLTEKGINQEPVVKRDVGKRDEEKDEVGRSFDKDEQWVKLCSGEEEKR